jgi:transposase
MISATHREIRDVLRARLLLVNRPLRWQRSVGALLEKYNGATPTELPPLLRLPAELHTAQRALLVTHVKRLARELRDRVLATPAAQRVVWGPGLRKMVAYTLLHEIADIHRFPSVRHVHSSCRFVPGSQDSGARRATNAPGMGIATSRLRSTMPRCAPSSTSRKCGACRSACNAEKGNRLRGR